MTTQKRDPKSSEHGHECNIRSDWDGYGDAITDCTEDTEGKLWCGNGEYGSQVNYCPVCGYEAKEKVK